jgi:alpha-ketoglutaric semialdehyde dehydrogenase
MVAFKNYVAGDWVDSSQAITNRNPADLADVVGEYSRGDKALVHRAVAAAQAAFAKW